MTRVIPILSKSNLKPNRFKYYVLNQGTSSTFIFIKIVTIQAKISFSRQGTFQYFHFTEYETKQTIISFSRQRHSSTFILPQSKPNTFETNSFQYFHFTEYKIKRTHISCFASRDKFKLLIYQTCRHIDQNLIFATRVNPIHLFYRVQNKIGSHILSATRDVKGQVQTSHLSNFATRVISILSFYRI